MPRSYADFARPTYGENRWLETQWFGLVTETGLRLHLWAGFRTNLGVAQTKVWAVSKVADTLLDMDFAEQQNHMPIGSARLADFSLWSGLSVRGHHAPDNYTVRYRSPCRRLHADLEVSALMPPVDLSWTRIQGAGEGFVAFHHAARPDLPENRAGLEPTGHIDQTMRVVGEVIIDGERQRVNCVANRDHSWSPRAEYRHAVGNFDMMHFGEEVTVLAQTRELQDGTAQATHAYVLRGKELRKARSIAVKYHREGFRTKHYEYSVVDETGERFEITGTQYASFEIDGGMGMYVAFDQHNCEWDGKSGWAETEWHHETTQLQGIRRRGSTR